MTLARVGIGMVTTDCADPKALAAFWAAALGTAVSGDYGEFVMLAPPPDGRSGARVPAGAGGAGGQEPAAPRPRRARRAGAQAEVARLVGLGATVLGERGGDDDGSGLDDADRSGGQRVLRRASTERADVAAECAGGRRVARWCDRRPPTFDPHALLAESPPGGARHDQVGRAPAALARDPVLRPRRRRHPRLDDRGPRQDGEPAARPAGRAGGHQRRRLVVGDGRGHRDADRPGHRPGRPRGGGARRVLPRGGGRAPGLGGVPRGDGRRPPGADASMRVEKV